ncbi:ScbA/BarX family gamma-butyrolactone biosynthesis protein [Streptomyces sp. NPDC018693]|uniref:ScbA/BarX family gamma-butyrolactone biosynthesis protein n=1 Tax=unclassified Streptomyces TaxID=2593676 RepID=UPI0037922C4E
MTRPRQLADTPSMTAAVPRQLVHRAAVAETLPTGWRRTGADRFTVSAQWPRAHGLHVSPDWSAYDPLLVVETIRQGGTLISHAEYHVPLDYQFVLQEFQVSTVPAELAVGALPAEPEIELVFTHVQYRGRRPAAARYTARVTRDGVQVATADVAFTCVSPAVYGRLRGGRTPETVTAVPVPPGLPPAAVGRALPTDVVLGRPDSSGRWQLRVHTAHPVFFDHPLDHVPGMLLLEAARQATRRRTDPNRSPASYQALFHRYAELDEPIWVEAKGVGEEDVQVVGTQGESAVFECRVGTVGA